MQNNKSLYKKAKEQEKGILSKRWQMVNFEDFEQVDLGVYECKIVRIIWEKKTDISIVGWEEHAEYGYNDQAVMQYIIQSNACLKWIGNQKEYIQKLISESIMYQTEYRFATAEKKLKKIQMEINVDGEESSQILACLYIDVKPFLCAGHCHCIEVAILAKEDGTYEVDVIEDMERLLLEIREVSKENNEETREWAKKNDIFYALDEEGNMLAVVRQQFCLSKDQKLIAETVCDNVERNALYLIWANQKIEQHCASSWEGIPMPLGFVTKEVTCKKNVFTITSSSGHTAVSGTFLVMQEALTMIEMLLCSRGVTEEEIYQCYYTFLVEDHQKYMSGN